MLIAYDSNDTNDTNNEHDKDTNGRYDKDAEEDPENIADDMHHNNREQGHLELKWGLWKWM